MLSVGHKQTIISALLKSMEHHRDDQDMITEGLLTLYQFTFPEDVISFYERLIRILLDVVDDPAMGQGQDNARKDSVEFLNLLCRPDGKSQELAGTLGVIEVRTLFEKTKFSFSHNKKVVAILVLGCAFSSKSET